MRLAAALWPGTEPLERGADEGPRHLRPAGLRLMHAAMHLPRERRGEIETYFDRTAVEAWARLTSDAPVGRIRATVRAGRDRMRATLLSLAARRPARPRAARCRLRHRRAGGRGRAARRRGAGDRPVADAGRPGARTPAGDRQRRRHRLPRRRHAGRRSSAASTTSSAWTRSSTTSAAMRSSVLAGLAAAHAPRADLHLRAEQPGAGSDARGGQAVSARRPRRRPSCRLHRSALHRRLDADPALQGWSRGRTRAHRQRLLHLPGAWSCCKR